GPAAAEMRRVGTASPGAPGSERPSVTIAVAKRKGSNAVRVSEEVLKAVEELRGRVIPDDVLVAVTRDFGTTADHKVNELVKHLLVAIATIIVLLAIALGPREAFIVAIAVPMTLAVTLLLDLVFGYTINRVTLFALILSLGLLVDDPIVDVENIYRHFQLRKEPPLQATLTAVDEVRPPTILATFTVIVSFLPMFFITGMMGPYMAPMAFNVPVAMLMSLVVAFTVTPWASYHLLKGEAEKPHGKPFDLKASFVYRAYGAVVRPLLVHRGRAALFLFAVVAALGGSAMLALTRAVPLKMLPFDNKNELAIVVDMPRGTALEETDAVARALGRYLSTVAEVTDFETVVGEASPIDFNGMVRHYYLRRGGNVADLRIGLLPKERRAQPSHEIALRIRPEVERIARERGANVKIVEAPPGPPVLSTLVAEVYGPNEAPYDEIVAVSKRFRAAMERTAGVVDVDDYAEAEHEKVLYRIDREKAALAGVTVAEVAETLRIALGGASGGTVHVPGERLPLGITLRLPREARSTVSDLLALRVRSRGGSLVPLGEIGAAVESKGERTIYHKNLRRFAIVTAEMAGRSPVDAVLDLKKYPIPAGYTVDLAGEGEWKITVDVFRDLGLAFAAAMGMIYVLLVAQTRSLSVPLVMMVAIPLTIIGIMPGFWLLNRLFMTPVAGYDTPVFFTATGMIGMIALAGIVVRNSIILIDFIEHIRRRGDGTPLLEAVVEAGATRFRPILLTAGAAMFGSFVITLDPIFSGLAWSFIFGIFASTAFSLVVVPVIFFLLHRKEA
ncbi:MAG TPA: efflux RND transporter permease subunit, partial [Planctomycetota bacterium]|nr:efflux RND transporter permease subunit [Planctomycetota bacterium]